jgi:hypothetical protein
MNIDKMIAKFDEIYPVGRVIQNDKYREIGSLINSLRDILEAGRDHSEEHVMVNTMNSLSDCLAKLERRIEQKDGERLFDNEVIMAKVSRLEEQFSNFTKSCQFCEESKSDEPKLPKLPKNWGKIKTPDGRIVDFETMKEINDTISISRKVALDWLTTIGKVYPTSGGEIWDKKMIAELRRAIGQ